MEGIGMRKLLKLLCLSVTMLGATITVAQAQVTGFAEQTRYGVIEEVELASSTILISGLRYRVVIDAQVEINGSYGAYSMLQKGMNVHFTYRVISANEREIIWLETVREIPPLELS